MMGHLVFYPVVRRVLKSHGYSYSLLNEETSYQEFPNHILELYPLGQLSSLVMAPLLVDDWFGDCTILW